MRQFKSRWASILWRWLLRPLAWTLGGVVVMVGLLLLALNLGVTRNFIRVRLNHALADSFQGQLIIDRIGGLHLDVIRGVDARVIDAQARQVLMVKGLRVQSNWPELVRDLIRKRPLVIRLAPTRIDYVDVNLVADKDGNPSLASAFNPRHPNPKPAESSDNQTSVEIRGIDVQRVWVHGSLPSVPTIDLDALRISGRFSNSAKGVSADIAIARVSMRSTPGQIDPDGAIQLQASIPAVGTDGMVGSAQFTGTLAQASVVMSGSWSGRRITARLRAPEIPASVIQQRLPDSKLDGPSSLEINVDGQLPRLHLVASVKSPAARLEATTDATLEERTALSCKLALSELDLAAWLGNVPRTRLSATANGTLIVERDGVMKGEYRLELPRGKFGDYDTPTLSSSGRLNRTSNHDLTVKGSLELSDPGIGVESQYQVDIPTTGDPVLNTRLAAQFNQPQRLRQLAGIRASGALDARAELKLVQRLLNANVHIHVAPISQERASVQSVDATIAAYGPLSAPELKIRLDARQGDLAGNPFSRLQLEAVGDVSQLMLHGVVEAEPRRLTVETRIAMGEGVALERPAIELSEREGPILVRADRVRLLPQRIEVKELRIGGLGELRLNGTLRGSTVDAQFETQRLDLARISRLANARLLERGVLSLTGKLQGTVENLVGHVQGHAFDLARDGLHGGQLDLDLAVTERRVNGSVLAKLGASQLAAELSDVDLPRPPFTPERMNALRGDISLRGDLHLGQLAPFLSALKAPIEQARGRVGIDLQARHPRASDEPPRILLHVHSDGLKLVEQRPDVDRIDTPTEAQRTKPRALEGIDGDVRLSLEPAQGRAQLGVSLFDQRGPLLTLVGESRLPASLNANLARELERVPMRVELRVPERAIETLPPSIRPKNVRGLLSAALDFEGTALEPQLRARLALQKLYPRGGRHFVEVQANADYDPSGGNVNAKVLSMRGGNATLQTSWRGNLLRRVREQDADRGFLDLQTDLVFREFPLGTIPALFERQIRGPLSGWVKLRGFGNDANLQAQLDASGLIVNRVRQPQLKATVLANDEELRVAVDATQEPGSAHVELSTKNRWGSRLLPQVDRHAALRLTANRFQLEALSPLVLGHLSTLEGELDANLLAQLDPDQPRLEGKAAVRKGVVQMPQIGQRFSDIQADVTIGNGEVRVQGIQARGVTGRVTGDALARLRGTELRDVSARVDIREQEKLPVTFEGVEIGEAWGHVDLAYTNSDSLNEIRVEVPRLHLLMPEVAQNSVQDLSPPQDIRVGTHRADGKFVPLPLQPLQGKASEDETPTTTRIRVRLGDSVWIQRGHQLDVQLAGELGIESGAEQEITGRIEIRSGKLDVSGKRFDLERGVVTFDPESDPSNPTVTATARWDSPVGYVVYADYAGTAKDGKLKLHSDPVLTQDEILSLIMFGSPEGNIASSGSAGTSGGLGSSTSNASSPGNRAGPANQSSGSGSPNAAGAAVSIAGSTATKGLNRALSDVTSLDVSTRIDSSTGSSRPELVVQLTPRLTTRLTRAIGEPAPGQSLDRTFLTLELRLKRAWSASAVIGDKGASRLDLIWRKRY